MSNILVFNDLSTVGNVSLNVVTPALSVLGHNVYPIATAVLSSQTGFDSFYLDDRLDSLNFIGRELEALDLKIDAILVGYLPSGIGVENLWAIIDFYLKKGAKLYVDPILGDNGELYSTVDEPLCEFMQELICRADYIFPNLTEACLLSGFDYVDTIYKINVGMGGEVTKAIGKKLLDMGAERVIITSILEGDVVTNLYMDDNLSFSVNRPFEKTGFSGTGDLFSAVVTGCLENNCTQRASIEKAADFVLECVRGTESYRDPKYGMDVSKNLKLLID